MILVFICYFGASLAKRDSGANLRDTCVADLLASWTLTVELARGLDGKRRQLHETYRGNKRQAQDRLAESIASVKDGYSIRPERITVQQFMADWLQAHASQVRATTLEGYAKKVNRHIGPALGRITLRNLQPTDIQAFNQGRLAGGLSASTVNHLHRILHEALEHAVRLSYIARNPAKAVTPPKPERMAMRWLNANETNRVLDAAKATPYYAIFHAAHFTGLRRSELLGLRVRDVDLTLGTVHVARAMHYLKGAGVVFSPPKTDRSRRTVALTPSNAVVLRDHLDSLAVDRALLGLPMNDDTLVFSWADGRPMLPNGVSVAWRRLVGQLGLKGVRLHDARHSHASLMLVQGIHPKIVQERLGHSIIAVTLDTYTHVAPGLQAAAALSFDTLMQPEPEKQAVDSFD